MSDPIPASQILSQLQPHVYVAGCQTMLASWSVPPRQLKVHDLIHVEDGRGAITVGETRYAARAGDWFLLPAGLTHSMTHDPKNPLTLRVVHFDASLAPSVDAVPLLFRPPVLDVTRHDEALACLRHLVTAHKRGGPLDRILADRWLAVLLCLLAGDVTSSAAADPRIATVLVHLHANYRRRVTLEQLGKLIHASPAHMRDLFKRTIGQSPIAYLQNVRLEKARQLLRATDLPVGEIARETGWEDQTAFGRVFRKRNGLAPAEYRASARSSM